MKINRTWLFFILIFTVGFFLRTYQITSLPPFDWDERSIGYNAYSIAKTGQDEWGKTYPLIFQAFGDNKLPLYIYLSSIFIGFFGLSILTTKLTALISGLVSMFVVYFLAKEIWGKKTGLIAFILITFSPYSIFYSRLAQETILAHLLIIVGIYFQIKYLKFRRWQNWLLSCLFLGFSVYAYNLARVIGPLLLIFFSVLNTFIDKKYLKNFKVVFIPLLIGLILIFLQFRSGGFSRFKETSIFGENRSVVIQINEYRHEHGNDFLSKVFHNKLTFYPLTFIDNYLEHFSPDFLSRMKITTGVQESFYPPLYLLTLPFFYYGLYLLLVGCFKSDNKSRLLYLVILLAILLAPLPSAITEGSPSAKRFLAVLGLLEITTAYGLISFWSTVKKNKQIILTIFITLYMVSVGHFLYFFYKVLPQKYDYVYAFKENIVSRYIEKYYSAAGYFILPTNLINQPYIYPLFHTSYDPTQFVREKKWVDCHCPAWYTIGSFDKFILTDKIDSQTLRVLPLNKAGLLFIGPEDFQSSDFKLYLKNRPHKLLGQYQPSETVTIDRIIYVIYFYEKK